MCRRGVLDFVSVESLEIVVLKARIYGRYLSILMNVIEKYSKFKDVILMLKEE